ncbi:MAG: cytochrome c biogenesis protein CcsA [Saprospiraceae bacterium]|jgi:heme exporter protein C|nr:cytochrome c biogenesis protein CcsA [Saprospiraceae bacterium]
MKNYWWKFLGVLLLIYTFVFGLLTPLKTGITAASPYSLQAGQTQVVTVQGYNSFFTKEKEKLRAWLKTGSEFALAASQIEAVDDRTVKLTFHVPAHLPTDSKVKDFTLLIDSPADGASILPGGLSIKQDSVNEAAGKALWTASPISQLHEKEAITFPFRNILGETIRNTYYHVPMWMAMFIILIGAVVFSIKYLINPDADYDRKAMALTNVGLLLGILGLITGAIWAKNTWGKYWSWDVKQNMTAIALLIYSAYFVLRASFEDPEKKARISAVFNIFAFASIVPLIYIIPKLTDSLHPGAGGNIAFGSQDLDNTMRMIFYPAIIGWALLGLWIGEVILRTARIRERILDA